MQEHQQLAPLGPIGKTDVYSFVNGVIAHFGPGTILIYRSAMKPPVTIPSSDRGVIIAVALAYGLTVLEGQQLANAAETYAPRTDLDVM